jgi:hypothetical protein
VDGGLVPSPPAAEHKIAPIVVVEERIELLAIPCCTILAGSRNNKNAVEEEKVEGEEIEEVEVVVGEISGTWS